MPTPEKKVIGVDQKRESLIKKEWRDFSKTTAFKDMMDFAKLNSDNMVKYAKDMAMPGPSGQIMTLSMESSNSLLQRSAGIDIMTSYIRLYSE